MNQIRIGLLLDESIVNSEGFSKRPYYALRKEYFDVVFDSNCIPICIPYNATFLEDYIALCDAFIIVGGSYDFHLDWYLDAPEGLHINESNRRDFEILFAHKIIESGKPVLGICCGMQVLAGIFGGKFTYDNRDGAFSSSVRHAAIERVAVEHDVIIEPNSALSAALEAGSIRVKSAHKESLVKVPDNFIVTARGLDGTVEAIELMDYKFALGVQWHPEIPVLGQENAEKIISSLVSAI